jgi:hypothetical protein
VVNGEKNKISLTVENKSDRNVTLTSIAGSFHHADTNAVIKNVRNLWHCLVADFDSNGHRSQLCNTAFSCLRAKSCRSHIHFIASEFVYSLYV